MTNLSLKRALQNKANVPRRPEGAPPAPPKASAPNKPNSNRSDLKASVV